MENSGKKLVVIPTYNEAMVIGDMITEVFNACPDIHILVVDDSSPDGTGDIVDDIAKDNPQVQCMHRHQKNGLGSAYVSGFKEALKGGYEYIAQMDADFSHNPRYLSDMFDLARTYDVVIGSRYVKKGRVENWGPSRFFISRFGSLYARAILGVPVQDLTSGFKCFRRSVLETIDLNAIISNGYAFQIETAFLAYRGGFKITELPIIFIDRQIGQTKLSVSIVTEAMVNVWKLRSKHRKP